MLPFKHRTNKISQIAFRNIQDGEDHGNYTKYYMEVSYVKPLVEGQDPEVVTFKSALCPESCICPSFELSTQNVRSSKDFLE